MSGAQVGTYTTPVYLNPRPDTHYGAISEVTNGLSSFYDALDISFEKRFSDGFSSMVSYTWSHEIDDGQGAATNAIYFSSPTSVFNGNYAFERGSGLLDQRHRLVYSFVWSPIVMHRDGGSAKYFANNWQLSSITTLAAGRPAGSETILVTDTPVSGMLYTSSLNGFGGSTRVPFLPVNGIYTPAAYREDFRLTKIISLPWERISLSLNFEAFNISNTWSPTNMTTQAYTEAKGVLTPTPTAFGVGSGDGGFPDGTQARRMQVSARITF